MSGANERVEHAVDFRRSFMRWDKPRNPNDTRPEARHNTPLGNRVRIEIESTLTVRWPDGGVDEFFLIAPCRTELVYAEERLFQVPSREFRCVYSRDRERDMGRGLLWDGRATTPTPPQGWELEIDVRRFASTEVHQSTEAITAASEGGLPMNGRTTFSHPDDAYQCAFEYPIKTMNFRPETPSFQVDTGPLVLPDVDVDDGATIERLVMAHIAYNRLDRAELIIRRPVPIDDQQPDGPQTLHYADVREYPAVNQVLTGSD